MSTAAPITPVTPALSGPFASAPAAEALRPSRATLALVREQVQALLLGSQSFQELEPARRRALARDLVKVASYAAECVRDDWYQSQRLGQRPLVLRSEPVAAAQAEQRPGGDFQPGAASRIGDVTRQTLNAVAFPTFVAELIRGTFDAITGASIKQMESYARLLGDVGRTVDDFMNQNISDDQARDWLAQSYPLTLRVEVSGGGGTPAARGASPRHTPTHGGRGAGRSARLVAVAGAEERPLPNWRSDLGVSGSASLDEDWLETKLVPAARRKLAQTRLQMLSTMVLMGMQRIAVTGGKIRATMAFHIDTSDVAHEEHATGTSLAASAAGSFGWGPWSASASASFAYVSSARSSADSEMNVATDLTSEVEIHFKSEAFPLERMAPASQLGTIRSHTAVPEANTPIASSGDQIAFGGEVQRAAVPARQRPTPSAQPVATAPALPTPPPVPDSHRDRGSEGSGASRGSTPGSGTSGGAGGTSGGGGQAAPQGGAGGVGTGSGDHVAAPAGDRTTTDEEGGS